MSSALGKITGPLVFHLGIVQIAQAIAQAPSLTVHHIRTAKGARTLLNWITDDH